MAAYNPNMRTHQFGEQSNLQSIRYSIAPDALYVYINFNPQKAIEYNEGTTGVKNRITKIMKDTLHDKVQVGNNTDAYIGELHILPKNRKGTASAIIADVLMTLRDGAVLTPEEMQEAAVSLEVHKILTPQSYTLASLAMHVKDEVEARLLDDLKSHISDKETSAFKNWPAHLFPDQFSIKSKLTHRGAKASKDVVEQVAAFTNLLERSYQDLPASAPHENRLLLQNMIESGNKFLRKQNSSLSIT